ncbi:MAG: hypothetical protein JWR32_4445 [Mycobacterium sp.]|nr:hypothetical protein [Mycobacterium sp.]
MTQLIWTGVVLGLPLSKGVGGRLVAGCRPNRFGRGDRRDGYRRGPSSNQQRAKYRPVMPITDNDRQALIDLLAAARRKAVYSLAVAVYRRWKALRDEQGGMAQPHESMEISKRRLLASRPGSRETQHLTKMALWVGAASHRGSTRPLGRRFLYRRVTEPARFTEVAETLAGVVAHYADSAPRGWADVADQWLQPRAFGREGAYLTYSLLYSVSARFDPAMLDATI